MVNKFIDIFGKGKSIRDAQCDGYHILKLTRKIQAASASWCKDLLLSTSWAT
jgi:hypothetical protein